MGVVYDQRTLAPQRVIVPDDDGALFDGRHLVRGEAMATMLLLDASSFANPDEAARAAVRLATGREPPSAADILAASAAGVPLATR